VADLDGGVSANSKQRVKLFADVGNGIEVALVHTSQPPL